ncbi:MAG: EAL domain-containing protein [Sedimenticola sp.]
MSGKRAFFETESNELRHRVNGFLKTLLPLTLLLGVLALSYGAFQSNNWAENQSVRERMNIDLGAIAVTQELDSVYSDLLVLARHNRFAKGVTPQLEQYLKVFSEEKALYDQIRLLSLDGNEILRVDYVGGKALIRKRSELQNKAGRYYFKEGILLQKGEVYISPLDLNMESGMIEYPHKPMIRFVTPLFDGAGKKQGLLILNYSASRLLERFRSVVVNISDHSMIVNRDGYWLSHPDSSREWGFMFGSEDRFAVENGEQSWRQVISSAEGQFDTDNGLVTFSTVWPLKSVRNRITVSPSSGSTARQDYIDGYYWKIISHLPKASFDIARNETLTQVFIVLVPIYLVSIIISWILARYKVERRRAESELRLAASVFEHMSEGILITDRKAIIRSVNPAFTRITGYQRCEAVGQTPSILQSGRHGPDFYREMWAKLSGQGSWEGELWNKRKSGEFYPERLSIVAIRQPGTEMVTAYAALLRDISVEKSLQDQLVRHAHYDNLTGLANRLLFKDRLNQAMTESQRRGDLFALMFIDLDRFKSINDTFGHDAGDEVLRQVSSRIGKAVRKSDTVARLGGDEFIVILKNVRRTDDARIVGGNLVHVIEEPVSYAGHELVVGASIGITVYPADGGNADTLLQNADIAMYQSKQDGRSSFHFFSDHMNSLVKVKLEIEHELRKAIGNGQLSLHYQPIVDIETQTVISAEALLRWTHPEMGDISPSVFIPVAEESGIIGQIGDWVFRETARQIRAWLDQGEPRIRISVNLSCRQLHLGFGSDHVADILDEYQLTGEDITFEITETTMMENSEASLAWMASFRELGSELSIDDFGTGYSSLGYLKRFPVNNVKIDRSFIQGITTDREDQTLTRAIIAMAESLGLGVIAEGVENQGQLEMLERMAGGRIKIQGFHFSKPLPADEFIEFTRSFNARVV